MQLLCGPNILNSPCSAAVSADSCKVAQVVQGLQFPATLLDCSKQSRGMRRETFSWCCVWDHRWWGRRTTCSGTGEEMGWTLEAGPARMRSAALAEVCTTCVCSDNPYFLAPRVTWWLLMSGLCGDPVLMKMCLLSGAASLFAGQGGRGSTGLHLRSIPSIAVALWLSIFSSLSSVTQQVVLCSVPSGLLNSGVWQGSNCMRALPGSGK